MRWKALRESHCRSINAVDTRCHVSTAWWFGSRCLECYDTVQVKELLMEMIWNDKLPMPKRSVEPIQQNYNKTCGCLFNCCRWLDIPIHRWTQLHRGRILQREAALQMQRLHRGVRETVFFVFFWLSRSSNIWLWGIWRRYEMMFACFSLLEETLALLSGGWRRYWRVLKFHRVLEGPDRLWRVRVLWGSMAAMRGQGF